jgi:hypothetical protein
MTNTQPEATPAESAVPPRRLTVDELSDLLGRLDDHKRRHVLAYFSAYSPEGFAAALACVGVEL